MVFGVESAVFADGVEHFVKYGFPEHGEAGRRVIMDFSFVGVPLSDGLDRKSVV